MKQRTRIGDAGGEELGDCAEEEEVEVRQRRCGRIPLRQAQASSGEDRVLELLEQLETVRRSKLAARSWDCDLIKRKDAQ